MPWQQYISESEFFEKIDDPFVQNCLNTEAKLINFKLELMLRFGIDDDTKETEDEAVVLQAGRFRLYILRSKRAKSYKKLRLHYERTITETLDSFVSLLPILTNRLVRITITDFKHYG